MPEGDRLFVFALKEFGFCPSSVKDSIFALSHLCFSLRDLIFAQRDLIWAQRDLMLAQRDLSFAQRDVVFECTIYDGADNTTVAAEMSFGV